jgi:hypothetical protein
VDFLKYRRAEAFWRRPVEPRWCVATAVWYFVRRLVKNDETVGDEQEKGRKGADEEKASGAGTGGAAEVTKKGSKEEVEKVPKEHEGRKGTVENADESREDADDDEEAILAEEDIAEEYGGENDDKGAPCADEAAIASPAIVLLQY